MELFYDKILPTILIILLFIGPPSVLRLLVMREKKNNKGAKMKKFTIETIWGYDTDGPEYLTFLVKNLSLTFPQYRIINYLKKKSDNFLTAHDLHRSKGPTDFKVTLQGSSFKYLEDPEKEIEWHKNQVIKGLHEVLKSKS